MKTKNKIILILMLLVICATLVSGVMMDFSSDAKDLCEQDYTSLGYDNEAECIDALSDLDLGYVNPREDNWYEVDDWEIEYCQREAPYDDDVPDVETDSGFPYLSQIAYTIIGEYTDMTNPVTGEASYFYEVNYYLYPWNDDYTYGVRLTHSVKTEADPRYYHAIKRGDLTAGDPESVYKIHESTEWYDQVHLDLQGTGDDTTIYTLTQPIINSITGDRAAKDATGVATDPAVAWTSLYP